MTYLGSLICAAWGSLYGEVIGCNWERLEPQTAVTIFELNTSGNSSETLFIADSARYFVSNRTKNVGAEENSSALVSAQPLDEKVSSATKAPVRNDFLPGENHLPRIFGLQSPFDYGFERWLTANARGFNNHLLMQVDIIGRKPAKVFDFGSYNDTKVALINGNLFPKVDFPIPPKIRMDFVGYLNPWPLFFAQDLVCRFRLSGHLCSLNEHVFGVVSGPFGLFESFYDRHQRRESDKHSRASSVKHEFRPPRHALLSVKVALFVFLLLLSSYLVFFGYKVADRGLDAFESGRKVYGFTLLITAALISCGSAFFLPWLIFGSGLAVSLP